ncbi:MAG: glycosyltransferase family 2 protein [Paludibacteraceae bacterium]|nr:glycosyltransferase family 2 protein [Paludibacteraceae bacterium]MBP6284905.1 glycosyltransferase family 2 protein [Paludibacteraceae bacterium]
MKLSIVIVNYKVPHLLVQCLDAVFKAVTTIEAEVFVVDNNSKDDSQTLVTQFFPTVTYIANNENVGFSKANNQAIKLAKGQYVLLLNPDTIILEDTLDIVCKVADNIPKFGALGIRMIDMNGNFLPESKRGIPTVWVAFCKLTFIHKLFPKSTLFNAYYYPTLAENELGEVPILAGAFMLINKQQLGYESLLDEQFFMYGEDIDLSYRIKNLGYKNLYIPSTILHYKGESTKQGDMKYLKAFYQSMLLFYKKHYAGAFPLWFYPTSWIISMYAYVSYSIGFKKPGNKKSKETLVLSTATYTYKEIISLIEQNKGDKKIKIDHPTYGFSV